MEVSIATAVPAVKQANRYDRVNGTWPPDMPKLDGDEAIRAARLLIREGFRYYGMTAEMKRKRKFKLTSGNRHTWPRRGVWAVNPNYSHRPGWQGMVHSISHWVHARAYPNRRGHDGTHSIIEKHLIEHVIAEGWLAGKLKREAKAKPERNVKAERHANVKAKMVKWEAKRKRAETALKKLRAQDRYYAKHTDGS